MRSFTTLCGSLLITLACVPAVPAHAQNDAMGNVQRFLGNGNSGSDRDGYEQGRRDEMRQQQADRERRREDRQANRDRDLGPQYNYQRNGYNDRYNGQRNGY
jgi:hypothetical protein